MSVEEFPQPDEQDDRLRIRRRRRIRAAAIGGAALVVLAGGAWLARVRIADHFVAGELASLKLPATYHIDSIGPGTQVLSHVVVGNPADPDLTVERLIAHTAIRGGVPGITGIELVRPRLKGRMAGGHLSLRSLDPLVYGPSTGPFRLPNLAVTVVDGEARIGGDAGRIGVALSGQGGLRGGFAGVLAAAWHDPALAGCRAGRAVFAGTVGIAAEQPRLKGPLRFDRLACGAGLAAGGSTLDLDLLADKDLAGGTLRAGLAMPGVKAGAWAVRGTGASVDAVYRRGVLAARTRLALSGLSGPQAVAATLGAEGSLRAEAGGNRMTAEGTVNGTGLAPATNTRALFADLRRSAAGTLAEPLLARMERGLAAEGHGSRLAGRFAFHRDGARMALMLPSARLTGTSGETVLDASRLGWTDDGAGNPRVTGNFATGGRDLPRIAARMEDVRPGQPGLRVTMADYAAGDAHLAIPELVLVQAPGGAVGFAGHTVLGGPLPGGHARDLALPLGGDWSRRGGFALWRGCTPVRFAELAFANLALENRGLTLCPQPGHAIVEAGRGGVRIAAGATSLDLAGKLGTTPIRLVSGPVGFAMPGALSARDVAVELGSGDGTSRFRLTNLAAKIGKDVVGTFAGTDVSLAAVPLDLKDATGNWRYADGRLSIAEAQFRVADRQKDPRFNPMVARDGALTLADSRIDATATLREPRSDRVVTRLAIRHDLADGHGHADLAVDDLTFDNRLQPDALTPLALGVVAAVSGKVAGTGTIDWTADTVTSGGTFHTDSLDLAAAFGPAKGLSGTIVFTDLLGMVTAPRQTLKIASINPGIEVDGGTLTYAMLPGHVLAVEGAKWPFLDGTLELLPTRMTMGISETRRYTLRVAGVNAAKFLSHLEISNLSATGLFDGTLPLVFDENGGRIEGGQLAARAPGGNVSYVGDLTYKDLTPMANFAFQTLRSLNYEQMQIGMDGAIAGELVTRLSMRGVHQGKGAKSNFLTRQIARLPIRFDVNVRAPFYQLVTSFKSFYDPAFVRDPRTLGLLDAQGRPVANPAIPAPPGPSVPPPVAIQPPVSESRP